MHMLVILGLFVSVSHSKFDNRHTPSLNKLFEVIFKSRAGCSPILTEEDLICFTTRDAQPQAGDIIKDSKIVDSVKWSSAIFIPVRGEKCLKVQRHKNRTSTSGNIPKPLRNSTSDDSATGDGGSGADAKAKCNGQSDADVSDIVSKLTNGKHVGNCRTFYLACKEGYLCVAHRFLTNKIVDINCKESTADRTAIMVAVINGRLNMFDYLVKHGSDLTAVDYYQDTVLHLACMGGNAEIVRKLIAWGNYDLEDRGWHGWTPLMNAVCYGNTQVFDFLVSKGSSMKVVDAQGNTILHLACKRGGVKMIKHILSLAVCDIERRGRGGMTSAMLAAVNGQKLALELLVSKGCNLTATDDHGNNVLHLACSGGHANVVNYTLSLKILDVDSRGFLGRTPAMAAALKGHAHIVGLLLKYGCDLETVDEEENTIFHYVCKYGIINLVRYLMPLVGEKGREQTNSHGQTPAQLALLRGHRAIVSLLKSA